MGSLTSWGFCLFVCWHKFHDSVWEISLPLSVWKSLNISPLSINEKLHWKLLETAAVKNTQYHSWTFSVRNCKFPRKFSWILTFVRSHWVNQCIIDQPAVMNLFFFPSLTVYTYIVSDTSSWDLHSFPSSSSEKEAWVGPQIPQVFSLLSRNKWTLRKRKQLSHRSADFKLAPVLGYVGSVTCMYSYVSSQRRGKVKLIKV